MVVFLSLWSIVFFYPSQGATQESLYRFNGNVLVTAERANAPVNDDQLPRSELPTTNGDSGHYDFYWCDKEDYVRYYRYPFKSYNVTTVDGYILDLHRIPYSTKKNAVNSSRRIPVVLAHGIFQDSSAFVDSGENSPAFIFSDAGYDVWMLNYRGNPYSRRHVHFVPEKDFEYWEYSFNELGAYDLPASIDNILSVSGQQQMFLVGYSMGGATVTVFLSENPKYNKNVVAMYLLAPAISMPPATHELAYQFRFIEKIFLAVLEDIEVLPYSAKLHGACQAICFGPLITLCKKLLEYTSQIDTSKMNSDVVVSQVTDLLSQVTVKMANHLVQMVVSNRFAKFDYGTANMEIYNQTEPPAYDIESITVPVTIFCGLQDGFINCSDMLATCSRFTKLVRMVSVPLVRHIDFVLGDRAKHHVYDVIVQDMVVIEYHVSAPTGHSQEIELPWPVSSAAISKESKISVLSSVAIADNVSHTWSPFIAVAIAFLMAFTVLLLTLSIRSHIKEKSANEHVSLVAYQLRPANYQGNG